MAIQMGIREFTKNFNKLQNVDLVEIVDKKTNKLKGVYLSTKEALKVKKILEENKKPEKEKKLLKIMKYAGRMNVDENLENLSKEELKVKIAELKNE
jgi:23S rRNA pseudoU1915 N3-methylase RlmH